MATGDHFDAATTDAEQIRLWAQQEPDANVGLCPDENFCFLETDDEAALRAACADLPPEVFDTTRAGANPNRCAFYYRQTMRTRKAGNMTASREGQENLFEFKQHRMIMTGPGSIHKNGNVYKADWKMIPAMPDVLLNRLCELYGAPKPGNTDVMSEDVKRQTELLDRFLATYEVPTTGDWFNKGKQWYRPIECPWADVHENESGPDSTCVVYTEGGGYGFDCKHRCSEKGWKDFRAELEIRFPERRFSFNGATEPVIGTKSPVPVVVVTDWREHYHTADELLSAPPVSFLIENFLPVQSITGIAAPVGQRKSLIALNVAHALCTGEPLFGKFPVVRKPSRVLYLCPEMGIQSFANRVRNIGLAECARAGLFYARTMNMPDVLPLTALTPEELDGAVVIVDTLIRYIEGDESSSQDMAKLAKQVFRLIENGAAAVIPLHHSKKETKEAQELTLENVLRGSGELGAAMTNVWGTRLQDPEKEYETASFLKNVKPRDYKPNPKAFEVKGDGTEDHPRLCFVESDAPAVLQQRRFAGNKDGKDDPAIAYIKANADKSARVLSDELLEHGIKRSKDWVWKRKLALCSGAQMVSG